MDRRNFLTWIGLGFLVSSSSGAIAGCQSTDTATSGATPTTSSTASVPPPPATESVAQNSSAAGYEIGTVQALDSEGFLSGQPDFVDAIVRVVRDPANEATLYAVNATCPHEQCDVDWKADQSQFICPCHAAKFAPDGTVLGGPAKSNLITYTARIEGDKVLVTES